MIHYRDHAIAQRKFELLECGLGQPCTMSRRRRSRPQGRIGRVGARQVLGHDDAGAATSSAHEGPKRVPAVGVRQMDVPDIGSSSIERVGDPETSIFCVLAQR